MSHITINSSELTALAQRIGGAPERIARLQAMAINKVTEKTKTRTRRMILASVNLRDSYVRERMSLSYASSSKPIATISARKRATTLATYGANQLTRSSKRAKGDPRRNIQSGRKQAGISVMVSKGQRKKMPGAFFIPLRSGKTDGGNGMGVFIRIGSQIKHRYGPSVDQVFRSSIDELIPQIREELTREITRLAVLEIRRSLK